MKNNGQESWIINNTKLIYDNSSKFFGDEIILQPQNPEEVKSYNIIIKNLKNYDIGEYQSYLWFCVDGVKFGDKITVKIIIKQNKKEIEEYIQKINEFRENFGLNSEDYSDEQLFEVLKDTNFNMEEAFQLIFT